MRKFSRTNHFPVPVWSRDCDVPEHRIYDVPYQIIKNCANCSIYKELQPASFIKKLGYYWDWMDLPEIETED